MQLLSSDDKKRIYKDGNKTYYMVNMGSYVGSRSREFYKPTPSCWRLMRFEEEQTNGEVTSINALVDYNGDYISLEIKTKDMCRLINFRGNFISGDKTIVSRNGATLNQPSSEYLPKEKFNTTLPQMGQYLSSNQIFTHNEFVYEG